jgi:DNA-binding NarL/FixJ family response regulator
MRAVLVLSSSRLRTELATALGERGYDVAMVDDVCDLADQVAPGAAAIVVFDDSHADWLRAVADQVAACRSLRPVLLASLDGADEFLAAVNAGVAGFCAPDAGVDAVVRTIETVREAGVAIPRSMVGSLVAQVRNGRGHTVQTAAGPVDVTAREWQILQLLMQRRSTKEMAEVLFVSVGTVRSHVSALIHKLGAVDRDDAVRLVERGVNG